MTQLKRKLNYLLSPLTIVALRIVTKLTGQQRARVLLFNELGEVLLMRGVVGRRQWSMPGGGIERHEKAVDGATRELYEETGIRVTADQLRYIATFQKPAVAIAYVAHVYTVTVAKNTLPNKLHNPVEVIEVAWHHPAHLPENLSPLVRPALANLLPNHNPFLYNPQ